MFAYCGNNPVAHSDAQGTRPVSVLEGEGYSVPVPKRARAKKENVIDSLVEQTRISERIVTHNNEKYTTYYVTIDSDAFLELSDDWNEISQYVDAYATSIYYITLDLASKDGASQHLIMSENHIYSETMAHLFAWKKLGINIAKKATLNVDEDRMKVLPLMIAFGYTGKEVVIYG